MSRQLALPLDVGRSELTDRDCAALWTVAAEPGDAVAASCRSVLGIRASMLAVVAGAHESEELVQQLAQHGRQESARRVSLGFQRWRARLASVQVNELMDRAHAAGVHFVEQTSPQWPSALADLGEQAPVGLWYRGALTPDQLPDSVALVGSRTPTAYGKHQTTDFGFEVASRGVAVVSGAAFGVDAAAHRGALSAGGITVAVLACGVDRCYPSAHKSLLDSIAQTGVVLSEYPLGQGVARHRFLQRNRILAALTGATVVVEAAHRSGALNTAGWAAELGRPLGAMPGPCTSALSVGPHRVIRDFNGTLIASSGHILELLGKTQEGQEGPRCDKRRDELSETERLVAEALPSRGGHTVAKVAVAAGLSEGQTQSVLHRLAVMGFASHSDDSTQTPRWRAG